MALINMQLTQQEAKEHDIATPVGEGTDAPRYPYGLTLHLEDEVLEKLGMSTLPDVGKKMTLVAKVEVTTVNQHQSQEGKDQSVSLQITDMELKEEGLDAATVLYGKT